MRERERLYYLRAQPAKFLAYIHVHSRFHHDVDFAYNSHACCLARPNPGTALHIV
jgi:hypothetical protein